MVVSSHQWTLRLGPKPRPTEDLTTDSDSTHCRKGCLLHNSTPHERKIGTQNMTAKGTRNATDNILVPIQTLRYSCTISFQEIATLRCDESKTVYLLKFFVLR